MSTSALIYSDFLCTCETTSGLHFCNLFDRMNDILAWHGKASEAPIDIIARGETWEFPTKCLTFCPSPRLEASASAPRVQSISKEA